MLILREIQHLPNDFSRQRGSESPTLTFGAFLPPEYLKFAHLDAALATRKTRPMWERIALCAMGIKDFLWLHRRNERAGGPDQGEPPAHHGAR
jgi:hypothetical protein